MKIYNILTVSLIFMSTATFSQVTVNMNLNVKHKVGAIDSFDRSKYITIHANQTEAEWDGSNFTSDLRNDFLNKYDVYLGRDSGGITWNLNNMSEDYTRPGFASAWEITSKGTNSKNKPSPKKKV